MIYADSVYVKVKMTLVIAHRLATLNGMDKILVFIMDASSKKALKPNYCSKVAISLICGKCKVMVFCWRMKQKRMLLGITAICDSHTTIMAGPK